MRFTINPQYRSGGTWESLPFEVMMSRKTLNKKNVVLSICCDIPLALKSNKFSMQFEVAMSRKMSFQMKRASDLLVGF